MAATASVAHPSRSRPARRTWPLATAALGATALIAATGALGARLVAVWPQVLASSQQWPIPSSAAIDALVAAPLLAAGTVVAAWWGLSLALITISLVADRAGMHSAALVRCVHAVAPRALRRLAAAGVSAGLGAGLTFSAVGAQAAQELPDLGWTTTEQVDVTAPHGTVGRSATGQGAAVLEVSARDVAVQDVAVQDVAVHVTSTDPTSLGDPAPQAPETHSLDGDARPDLSPGVVVVAPGDTLWDLAAAHLPPGATDAQIATSWHAWYELNVTVIGSDPDLLQPGQLLQVPPTP